MDIRSHATTQDSLNDILVDNHIRKSLAKLGYRQLNDLQLDVIAGIVLLRGEVDSYYLCQLAQQTAKSAEGVRDVVNEIVVVSDD